MNIGSRPLVPSRIAGGAHGTKRAPRTVVGGYISLTKPRIIELLLVTTVPTMVLAEGGWPSTWLVIATVIGGTFAAGGANAINMVIDRDIDPLMERTKNRPLVTGIVKPRGAMIFAISLEILAFGFLWITSNLLAAILAVSATMFYVLIYSLWLKRTSRQNIVIGGAAGAAPVLVGWAAVTNGLGWSPWVLFALIFLWTPPHFWALAIKHVDEYRAANVPMLPVVATMSETLRSMVIYTVALVSCSVVLIPVANLGWVYGATAAVAGALFLAGTLKLAKEPTESGAMRLFSFSISYITLLFTAIAVDTLVK